MENNKIDKIKAKYFNEIDTYLTKVYNSFHSELFAEESDYIYDSITDSNERKLGINPMSKEYIQKYQEKRKLLKVSEMIENGLPNDNSSSIYIRKEINNYLINKISSEKHILTVTRNMNISSYFKNKKDK